MDTLFNYVERVKANGWHIKNSTTELEVWHPSNKPEAQPKKIEWVIFHTKDGRIEYCTESLELAEKWLQEKIGWGQHKYFKDANLFKIKKIIYWN